jgi:chorismate lyase / 3-hydroxybenzoate synthase
VSLTNSNRRVVERSVGAPVTSAQRLPSSNAPHPLCVGYVGAARLDTFLKPSSSNVLGIVRYENRNPRAADDFGACPVVCLDLPQFNGPPLAEVWTSALPVTYRQTEGIHCAMNDEVLFGALQVEECSGTMLAIVTYNAYRRLLVQVRALGYPHLLRVWNYFPHITRESGGLERYQRFCAGRHQALAEDLSNFPRTLPAGTAVGTRSGPLNIHFLAARQPGTHVENPRQVSAYEYPRIYGPRSPSFARATLRPSISGSHLLISGTASVVGHMSVHIGEPHTQTLEIIRNLNALLAQIEQLHGVARGEWYGQVLFKIYIRHLEHFAIIRDILKEQLPSHTQVLYLQGEMCRSELLVEIEGILDQEEIRDVSQTVSPTRGRLRQPTVSQHG